MRRFVWGLGLSCVTGAILVLQSCKSTPPPVGLSEGCAINSDCDNPLICAFARCHEACSVEGGTRDCPSGQNCVPSSGGDVCLLPEESQCTPGSGASCTATGTTCSASGYCGAPCGPGGTCSIAGQTCSSPGSSTGTCLSPGIGSDGGTLSEGGEAGPPDAGDSGSGGDSGRPTDAADAAPSDTSTSTEAAVDNVNVASPTFTDGGDPDGGLNVMSAPSVDVTTSGTFNCPGSTCPLPPPATVVQNVQLGGIPQYATLYVVANLAIESNSILNFQSSPYPVIIAVVGSPGDVHVYGLIQAGGTEYTAGPGGAAYPNFGPGGGGTGGGGTSALYPNSAPGGASYCGVGGVGAATMGSAAPGGQTYGSATLVPLIAGSGGGNGSGDGQSAGGGGAIQIIAPGTIVVSGGINAGGGGGGYGGGGSGGAILLEAPTVTISGVLAANGGGGTSFVPPLGQVGGFAGDGTPNAIPAADNGAAGGEGSAGTKINGAAGTTIKDDAGVASLIGAGGGGAGWIRINTASGMATITGTISPDPTTSCFSQGKMAP